LRRSAWHPAFVHAHCRFSVRGSGLYRQWQKGHRFRGRIGIVLLLVEQGAARAAGVDQFAAAIPGGGKWISGRGVDQFTAAMWVEGGRLQQPGLQPGEGDAAHVESSR